MRVFYDHQIFCEQSFGGISRYYFELINGARLTGLYTPVFDVKYADNVFSRELTSDKSWLTTAKFKGRKDLVRVINHIQTYIRARKSSFDIFHPTYFHQSALQNRMGKPMIITVLDMIDEKYHHEIPKFSKLINHRKKMILAADHIIAISENTRKDIIEYFNLAPSKVTTIYLGSSLDTNMINSTSRDTDVKPNILFIGSRKGTHKNLENYIRAISLISKQNKDLEFLFGGGGEFNEEEKKLFTQYEMSKRITYKPIRSDSDLIRLYKNASLLVYPSLYEGFGLPLVEAFSCGTPCATALGSCLEEVGGDAAVYFDPLDPENMAAVSLDLLASPDKCAAQIEKGLRRASEFTWTQTLNHTHELYKKFVK